MLNTHIMELLIARNDHRVLSANAEAWSLVNNNIFLPMEHFLSQDSREAFCARLSRGQDGWFPVFFQSAPDHPYLMRIEHPGEGDDASRMIRLVLIQSDQVISEFLLLNAQLSTMEAMLSLSEDVFFEYDPEARTLSLLNTTQSRYTAGIRPFDPFCDELRAQCAEAGLPELEAFVAHLENGSPRFLVTIPQNLFNSDPSIPCTMIRGVLTRRRDDRRTVVGVIHPQRARGHEDPAQTYDPLTGLYTKDHITRLAVNRIDQLHAQGTTLAIVDIDYFKHANDAYGHQFGDQVLREAAAIMETTIGNRGIIGRIGGDEFLIVFYRISLEDLRAHLRSIKSLISSAFPDRGPRPDMPITVSIGAASYPGDAACYQDVFTIADYCLYLAKQKGRNRYVHYTTEKHPPLEEIRKIQAGGERNLIYGRDDLPLGDVIVQLQYLIRYGSTPPPLSSVLNEFAFRFQIPLVLLGGGSPIRPLLASGDQRSDGEAVWETVQPYLFQPLSFAQGAFHGMTIFNQIPQLNGDAAPFRDAMLSRDVQAAIFCPFTDRNGHIAVLVLASLHRPVFWNEQHLPYYRLMIDMLAQYVIGE